MVSFHLHTYFLSKQLIWDCDDDVDDDGKKQIFFHTVFHSRLSRWSDEILHLSMCHGMCYSERVKIKYNIYINN